MRSLNFDVLNHINELFINDSTAQSYINKTFDDPFVADYINFVTKVAHLWNDSERRNSDVKFNRALDESLTRTALFAEIPDVVLTGASIQLNQYVAICSLGGVACDKSRDFALFFHAYYFNCYTYSAPTLSRRNDPSAAPHTNEDDLPWLTPGLDNGLSMVLLTGSGMLTSNDDIKFIPGLYDTGSATAGGDGVRVIVHAPDVKPFPLAEGFDVPPGYSASFGVRPRRNVRIGPPHGNCRSEELAEGGEGAGGYRQLACQQICVQRFIFARCECYDETLPISPDESGASPTTCHSMQHFPHHCRHSADDNCTAALLLQYERVRCSRRVRDEVRLNRSMIAECGCRPTCNEIVYDVSYSVSRWPAAGFEGDAAIRDIVGVHNFTHANFNERQREQIEKLDPKVFVKDFARINVYVSDPEVLETRETPEYDTAQLISDIGGQLGVWIGLSLITVAEVVELVGQVVNRSLLTKCRRLRHRRSPSPPAASIDSKC
jgi:hypothetical protein